MKIGISTACLYPLETEKSLEKLAKIGFKDFEIFINDETEIQSFFIQKFLDLKKEYGLNLISVHSCYCTNDYYMIFSNYPRRFQTGLEKYSKLFAFANKIGAKFVVFHGDKKERKNIPVEDYCESFKTLSDQAKEHAIILLQENVAINKSGSLDFLCEMKRILNDDVFFTLDIKQAKRMNLNPCNFLDKLGTNIKHIHINDNTKKEECLLPGVGTFDYDEFFSELKKINYKNSLIIEVYRSNFISLSELTKSLKFLNEYV